MSIKWNFRGFVDINNTAHRKVDKCSAYICIGKHINIFDTDNNICTDCCLEVICDWK